MSEIRRAIRIITGKNAVDGAGVHLVRVFGNNDTGDFDPFLMLDAFDSYDPADYIKGFPWHPHRGIETVTYLLEGDIEHGDSLGNSGSILDGQCQWMTAGSGIIHQEMPKPSRRMLGCQLWLNLPAAAKMTEPRYRPIAKEDIPVVSEDKVRVHILAGSYKGNKGALQGEHVKATYLDVELDAGAEWLMESDSGETLFVYVLSGNAVFGPAGTEPTNEKHAILFGAGEVFRVAAPNSGTRFLLLSGKPLGEPVAWGGPIVMNTRNELETAFRELDEGTFIKTKAHS
ncbi:MAG: pirin family protein [Clostridiales bacterium]|nr:pirin family protein [Clostridiales bacterium]